MVNKDAEIKVLEKERDEAHARISELEAALKKAVDLDDRMAREQLYHNT